MRVTVTGATGLVGPALVSALHARGWQVTILSRDPGRARAKLAASAPPVGTPTPAPLEAYPWDPLSEPAPVEALAGRDAVVHLAGEPIAQRWTATAKQRIRASRVQGTRNLLGGLRALDAGADALDAGADALDPQGAGALDPADAAAGEGVGAGTPIGPRPRTLIGASAIGYYGPHGDEPLDEEAPAGEDFLAQICAAWEAETELATELGMRVVEIRTGIVLDRGGGALAKMLLPFRLGIGGPVAGGDQFISWIHRDDLVAMMVAALRDDWWQGPINATAPTPVTNGEFAKALGRVLKRPAVLPVPGLALRLLYGEMAAIVTTGARVLPAKALTLGYSFHYPDLDGALRSALG